MKNSTVIALALSGLMAALFILAFMYSTVYAGIVDDVLPVDKDKILEPVIGTKPEPDQVVPKEEPILVTPYSDQQAKQIRQEWQDTLGIDVWQPYYMLQDFENTLRNKLRFKLGPFVGKPYFNYKEKQIEYRFIWRF